MVARHSAAAVAMVALLTGAVSAQYNATYIDPNTVDAGTRASWCNANYYGCTTLCDGSTDMNSCDSNSLTWNCTCSSNHSSPDLAAYMNTMPYYICEESYAQCVDLNPNNLTGQTGCTHDIQDECGTLDLSNYTPAPSSSSAAPTSSASKTHSASASATTATAAATSSNAAMALQMGKDYGLTVLATTLFGVFAALL